MHDEPGFIFQAQGETGAIVTAAGQAKTSEGERGSRLPLHPAGRLF